MLVNHVMETLTIGDIDSCYRTCAAKPGCQSINYYRDKSLCELNSRTIENTPDMRVANEDSVYFTIPGAIGIQNKNIISDYYMTASRNYSNAKKARLNGRECWWIQCWTGKPCNKEWLQINVGKIAKIIGIATQGQSYDSGSYFYSTEKYNLSYSNESKFTFYSKGQVFQGNTDGNTIVYHNLAPAITARYVRIHPMKDNDKSGAIALRMELYESKEDEG
ncbi:Coagulation factor VIII [Exaiptasia diaphana]|nr:Coagulation factor VIII [Exaiptasia diaphana]